MGSTCIHGSLKEEEWHKTLYIGTTEHVNQEFSTPFTIIQWACSCTCTALDYIHASVIIMYAYVKVPC